MRFRFSLRTFLVLVALLAAFCYFWFVMPTRTANRFIEAVQAKEYDAADLMFRAPDSRFIASSAEKYWAFEATAERLPISLHQLLTGRRNVLLHFDYFHLDHNVDSQAHIAATPFGLGPPVISRVGSAMIIDRNSSLDSRDAPRAR
jgi:hypothetical protein